MKKITYMIYALIVLTLTTCDHRNNASERSRHLLQQNIMVIGDSLTLYSGAFYLRRKLNPRCTIHYQAELFSDFEYWKRVIKLTLLSEKKSYTKILVPLGTNDGVNSSPDRFMENVYEFHRELRSVSGAEVIYFLVPLSNEPSRRSGIANNNIRLKKDYPKENSSLIDLENPFQSDIAYPLYYSLKDPLHPNSRGFDRLGDIIAINMPYCL